MTKQQIKSAITRSFTRYLSAPKTRRFNPIPKSLTSGKLYEAYILGVIARELATKEGLRLQLAMGTKIRLRSSPGPRKPGFPYIDVFEQSTNNKIAEIWTDIEFLTLSYDGRGRPTPPERGDYHELDIVMLEPHQMGYPSHYSIWLGVECKNTRYNKQLLKEILGIRRELSLLTPPQSTRFQIWPRSIVPASPSSCLLVYSTYSGVDDYKSPGEIFGIDFYYEPL
jgi:hypothetical protein